jgi:IS1 family transposase/transposase-like protein
MQHQETIHCPHCEGTDLQKNGKVKGVQNFFCKSCRRYFKRAYRYRVYQPGVREEIDKLTLNGSGVRDVARVLNINKNTVSNHFKKKAPRKVNPYIEQEVAQGKTNSLVCQLRIKATQWDEMWSYCRCKRNQRWTWYIICHYTGRVVAWICGPRTDAVLEELLEMVAHLPIKKCLTDAWGGYVRKLKQRYKHLIGKEFTQDIERRNLNFRTHLKRLHRRTICFSKDETIHDNVIGMYIERYYFHSGTFNAPPPEPAQLI